MRFIWALITFTRIISVYLHKPRFFKAQQIPYQVNHCCDEHYINATLLNKNRYRNHHVKHCILNANSKYHSGSCKTHEQRIWTYFTWHIHLLFIITLCLLPAMKIASALADHLRYYTIAYSILAGLVGHGLWPYGWSTDTQGLLIS